MPGMNRRRKRKGAADPDDSSVSLGDNFDPDEPDAAEGSTALVDAGDADASDAFDDVDSTFDPEAPDADGEPAELRISPETSALLRSGGRYGIEPDEIDRLPVLPGVYLLCDRGGKILYIGKAANLRSRVKSYFTREGDARFNVRFLMRHVRQVATIITTNQKEAFLLEDTLIKREQPRYNIRLRDDKTYVSVRFDLNAEWPRAIVMRRRNERDGAVWLGPYDSAHSVRETLRLLQRVFPIRSCSDSVLYNRSRPCLLHQIGRCCAPCVKPIDPGEYRELVRGTILVLKGKTQEVIEKLRSDMDAHSEAMEFEQAAALRDRIAAIERTTERQRVFTHDGDDRDVIVFERGGGRLAFTVFVYRNGLLLSTRPYVLRDHERDPGDLLNEFIHRYYQQEIPPREVLVDVDVDDRELLEEWLSERREAKSEIVRPQRGDKVRLIEVARENCKRLLEQYLSGRESLEEIHAEIMKRFHLDRVPDPIECYDISTLGGFASVGSQVTFRRGEPDKSRYRIYKIRGFEGQDDFASLREVLTRRFAKAVEKEEPLPGLVLIDGGKGQLAVAEGVFSQLGITGVGLAGIAKSRLKPLDAKAHHDWRESAEASGSEPDPGEGSRARTQERFFLPGRKNPVIFHSSSPALYLLQRARDEAHRFGITAHRKQRKKRNLRSSLEDLPGVGKTRARQLLKAFGSLKSLRDASAEEIAAMPGMPKSVAATVHEFLNQPGARDPAASPDEFHA